MTRWGLGSASTPGTRHVNTKTARLVRLTAARSILLASALTCSAGLAADVTFNIDYIAEANPFPPISPSTFSYADVWAENGYAYVGSDRSGRGVAIFSISSAGVPTYLATYDGIGGDGSEMEDVEVYDGIGYFASDVNTGATTGVDIVNLSIPFDPQHISRVNSSDCLAGNPSVCAHNKVHTLSVSEGFLYTSDNATDVVKITRIFDPGDPDVINPQLVASLDIGAPSGVASHEVVVRNDRLYVASKSSSDTTNGWFHIYDVANPASPVLLKAFLSGAKTHTAMPSADGKTLIAAEERSNGNVKLYDISQINEPNDPDSPALLSTLNTSNVCHNGDCISAHSPHHVHVHGNLMFLPWYEAGLQVFNIANPAAPIYLGAFDTFPGTSSSFNGNWGVDLSLGLDRVLISDRSRGLVVVDVTGLLVPGDYNQDNTVDDDDYTVWRNAFGTTTSGQHDAPLADGNYDGIVDAADYIVWREHLGQTGLGGSLSGALSALPEPATMFFIGVSFILIVSCWRIRTAGS